jgi:hypothetical protein
VWGVVERANETLDEIAKRAEAGDDTRPAVREVMASLSKTVVPPELAASHHLCGELASLQWELCKEQGGRAAAECVRRVITCMDAVLTVPTLQCGFKLEDLSRHLIQVGDTVSLQEAALWQRRALRILTLACGENHPFATGAAKRLKELKAPPLKSGCAFCGSGGGSSAGEAWEQGAAELMLCSRCKGERYCGARCQRAAWPVHKRMCAAAAAAAAKK